MKCWSLNVCCQTLLVLFYKALQFDSTHAEIRLKTTLKSHLFIVDSPVKLMLAKEIQDDSGNCCFSCFFFPPSSPRISTSSATKWHWSTWTLANGRQSQCPEVSTTDLRLGTLQKTYSSHVCIVLCVCVLPPQQEEGTHTAIHAAPLTSSLLLLIFTWSRWER